MKSDYEPDNTRSSIVILASLAIIVSVIAALFGLSDKPDVSLIAVAPGGDVPLAPASILTQTESDSESEFDSDDAMSENESDPDESISDGTDSSVTDTQDTQDTQDTVDSSDQNTDPELEPEPTREIIVIPPEPTATPEVAAAVEPTAVPDEAGSAETTGDVSGAPSVPTTAGVVQGTFFTRNDESEGAIVNQNLITVSFAEDGTGNFQGVLEIMYPDETRILLNMAGPLTFAPTTPQVETDLSGAFTLDAPIDADDIMTNDAELIITSLDNGSGSLCTSRCFGFTFPPP